VRYVEGRQCTINIRYIKRDPFIFLHYVFFPHHVRSFVSIADMLLALHHTFSFNVNRAFVVLCGESD
jgi:hypothetical protein